MVQDFTRLSQDLNLLVPLEALLVERHVTRAAERAGMTQPAMSRALGRLRRLLGDELLIRTQGRYEMTALGRDLLDQTRTLMPALRAVFNPSAFEPATAITEFRVAGTDYPTAVLGPGLVRRIRANAPHCTLVFRPWQQDLAEQLASGTVDAMLVAVTPPPLLQSKAVLRERMVCVVDERHQLATADRITIDQYLDARHLSVTTEGASQATVDGKLAAAGQRRATVVSVPTHLAALRLIRGSDLVATLPREAINEQEQVGLRIIQAPATLKDVTVSLVWHPRSDAHHAQRWLRQQIRESAAALSLKPPS